jgi:hypothetical protein
METAFLEQLFNIAQRKRVAKIPPDGTKDEAGFGLPPLEDRGSGYHFAILSRYQPATLNVATHPFQIPFRVDVRTIVYCVTENGNKFILSEPVDSNQSLTVVLNWTAGLKL